MMRLASLNVADDAALITQSAGSIRSGGGPASPAMGRTATMLHGNLRRLVGGAGVALVVAAPYSPARGQPGFPPNDPDSWRVAGTAKILCSALFVSGRDSAEARDHVTPYFLGPKVDSITKLDVDRLRKLVRLTVANRITREAKLYGDQGCIIHQPGRDSVFFTPVRVTSALPDASTTPWPMGDVLPKTPLPAEIDTAKLRSAVDAAFATPEGFTAAFVVVYDGRIIAERYGAGANKDMQLESWSMGKSIVGTMIGMLVQQGVFKLEDPAPVPAWHTTPGDPRAKIRLIDLMRMSSGLRFSRGSPEDIPGYHDHDLGYTGAIDAYAFATSVPLQFEPNTFGRYRNSDPLTLGLIVRDAVRKRGAEYLTWPQRELFDRIGIRRQVLETDPYGNFLITGYDYGTGRNWARLGMLYLNDGVWQGRRLLPEGWTKFVSTPAPAWKDSSYGAMVWVNAGGAWPELPRDAFAFRGAGLQDTYVIPSRKLVIVRMGHFVGMRAGTADLRRANALLMEAIR
jgi:CubicO group peptidase (beta-lactamase class C family)